MKLLGEMKEKRYTREAEAGLVHGVSSRTDRAA